MWELGAIICTLCFSLHRWPLQAHQTFLLPLPRTPHLPPSSADVSCLGSRYQQLTWHSSWPSKPVNHLKRATQELEQELRRISNEMRKVRRQRPTGGNVQISAAQRTRTRALMVMRDGEPTATMTFLRSKRKGADPNATRWAEMDSELREWWISADENTKTKHRNISDANQNMHNAIKAAQRFIVDDDLESWVAHQNVSKGINPAPALTLQEARVVKERMGVQAPRTHRGARQWLQRWRRRRELRLRKFPVLEPLDERDMHGKATSQTNAKKTAHVSPPNKFWL